MSGRRIRWLEAAAVAAAVAAAGTGIAIATAGDDRPLTGNALERAKAAALEYTGGGTVVETEVGDDGAAYGVEIRQEDGRFVEVALDESYNVIGRERDDDAADQEGSVDD